MWFRFLGLLYLSKATTTTTTATTVTTKRERERERKSFPVRASRDYPA